MEIKIVEEKENPFLERKELKIKIIHKGEATPSKASVEEIISKRFGVDVSHIIIDYIFTETGKAESLAKVKVYKKPVRKVEKKEEAKEKQKEETQQQEEKPKEESREENVKEGEKDEAQTK